MLFTGLAALLVNGAVYYDMIMNICLGLVILQVVATVIVRLTPTPKDDEFLTSFRSRFLKAMSILPTWGTNPLTKKAFNVLKEMDQKSKEVDAEEDELKL